MIRRTTLLMAALALVALTAPTASAQNLEISGTAGWTLSDGVSGDARDIPGVGVFDRVDPKDAFSWGFRLGYMLGDNNEIGFLFDQQSTDLELGGTSTFELASVKLNNYHGYYAYNFGDYDATTRPYILIGLGATQYGSITANIGNVQQDVGSSTKFSGTGALGVKVFPAPRFGLRLEARWTPTYIKSDAAGWWCDPFWGCYVVGDAQYANQFEFSGGIILKF